MTSRRSDDGFTLAETLIALFVVSIAMACVLAGFSLLSRFEHAAQVQRQARRANDEVTVSLREAVTEGEAISLKAFKGNSDHLDYACGLGSSPDSPKLCTLKAPNDLRFGFISKGQITPAWPDTGDDTSAQLLEALILQSKAGTTVSVARIQAEQGRDCQFDTVSRTCRGEMIQKP